MLHRKTSRFYLATLLILLVTMAPANSWAQRQALSEQKRIVYVVGAVKKPGGYVIQEGERFTILKALKISDGLTETADKSHSRIIRRTNRSTSTIDIDVKLTEVLRGKSLDMQLVAGDILFVPDTRKPLHQRYPGPFYDSPPQEINPLPGLLGLSKA